MLQIELLKWTGERTGLYDFTLDKFVATTMMKVNNGGRFYLISSRGEITLVSDSDYDAFKNIDPVRTVDAADAVRSESTSMRSGPENTPRRSNNGTVSCRRHPEICFPDVSTLTMLSPDEIQYLNLPADQIIYATFGNATAATSFYTPVSEANLELGFQIISSNSLSNPPSSLYHTPINEERVNEVEIVNITGNAVPIADACSNGKVVGVLEYYNDNWFIQTREWFVVREIDIIEGDYVRLGRAEFKIVGLDTGDVSEIEVPTEAEIVPAVPVPVPSVHEGRAIRSLSDDEDARQGGRLEVMALEATTLGESAAQTVPVAPSPMINVGEAPTCRVCLVDDPVNELISVCACNGSLQWIHLTCLRMWMNGRLGVDVTEGISAALSHYYFKTLECELCKQKYPKYVRLQMRSPHEYLSCTPGCDRVFRVQSNFTSPGLVNRNRVGNNNGSQSASFGLSSKASGGVLQFPGKESTSLSLTDENNFPIVPFICHDSTSTGTVEELFNIPTPAPPYLIMESTEGEIHYVSLSRHAEAKIGRGHGSDVRLPDISISRIHMLVSSSDNKIVVKDLHSKFGTLLRTNRAIPVPDVMKLLIDGKLIYIRLQKPLRKTLLEGFNLFNCRRND